MSSSDDVGGSVAEFYAGKSVFITGGTGFLGKVFIEKLIYSCKDIGTIFVLVRDKKGTAIEERVEEIINKPLFSKIRSERPEDLKKIKAIAGNINQPRLGISPEDERLLIDTVSVVFHVAATVKFDERIDIAVNTNVKGTINIMDLCHRMKNLKVYVHVSTAYCNSDHKILEEKVYPPRAELDEVLQFVDQFPTDQEIDKTFFKGLPNTYAFTKGLAENYVEKHRRNIPTVILRPSIVSPSMGGPLPGWTDNWYGAPGIIITSVKGANRILLGDGKNILDLIPVDYVSIAGIAAAARCSSSNALTVFNCCTSSCNPITSEDFFDGTKNYAVKIGLNDNAYPILLFTHSEWILSIVTFLLQRVSAFIADMFAWASGKQPKYMKLQSKIIFGRDLYKYYTSNSWEMKCNNLKSLHASLSNTDKSTFPCDPSTFTWDKYCVTFIDGVKKYLLKC
ncbi:putative fatty acyl-CoA reductase CG5065 [Anticarsia gemmatalis]|uniref:putative fatty acyl-CoA reductase CG5065 n=1 Tax=Anticarsia gemmatalis TaxID=129554 RepID=UPI003F75F873